MKLFNYIKVKLKNNAMKPKDELYEDKIQDWVDGCKETDESEDNESVTDWSDHL